MKIKDKIKKFFAKKSEDPFEIIKHKLLFLKGELTGLDDCTQKTNEKIKGLKDKLKKLIEL